MQPMFSPETEIFVFKHAMRRFVGTLVTVYVGRRVKRFTLHSHVTVQFPRARGRFVFISSLTVLCVHTK